jgi:hypothetical protein
MKAVFVAVVLGIACSALQAQVLDRDRRKANTAIQPDNARSVERRDRERHERDRRDRQRRQRDERPIERETSEGTFKLDRARPGHTRRSAPSPAEQRQRQLYEQRQSRQR